MHYKFEKKNNLFPSKFIYYILWNLSKKNVLYGEKSKIIIIALTYIEYEEGNLEFNTYSILVSFYIIQLKYFLYNISLYFYIKFYIKIDELNGEIDIIDNAMSSFPKL